MGAAAAAACAAVLAGRADEETVAEWRGRGRAVSFANFGSPSPAAQLGAGAGTDVLIDRSRFFVDWKRPDRVLVAGMAEYAFEGNFDFYP